MGFQVRAPDPQNVPKLIGLFGESGSGKTFSALSLLSGMLPKGAKIAVADTELGRSEMYAKNFAYQVIPFDPPYSPKRYIELMDFANAQGVQGLIIDSMSHEWEGTGGVLDMVAKDTGYNDFAKWKAPKAEHMKLVHRLMRSGDVPTILCFRAKHKTRLVPKMRNGKPEIGQNGKPRTEPVRDEFCTPIQSDNPDFTYDLTAHIELGDGGIIKRWAKVPDFLRPSLPVGQRITPAMGASIMQAFETQGAKQEGEPQNTPLYDFTDSKGEVQQMDESQFKIAVLKVAKHPKAEPHHLENLKSLNAKAIERHPDRDALEEALHVS